MAPKKKPGKKEDGLSDKELLQKAEAELLSLRRLLELKTFEVLAALLFMLHKPTVQCAQQSCSHMQCMCIFM
jgi:hypothetical protein